MITRLHDLAPDAVYSSSLRAGARDSSALRDPRRACRVGLDDRLREQGALRQGSRGPVGPRPPVVRREPDYRAPGEREPQSDEATRPSPPLTDDRRRGPSAAGRLEATTSNLIDFLYYDRWIRRLVSCPSSGRTCGNTPDLFEVELDACGRPVRFVRRLDALQGASRGSDATLAGWVYCLRTHQGCLFLGEQTGSHRRTLRATPLDPSSDVAGLECRRNLASSSGVQTAHWVLASSLFARWHRARAAKVTGHHGCQRPW